MNKTQYLLLMLVFSLTACDSPTKREFMKGCTNGASEKACECAYNILEKKLGEDTLENMHKNNYLPPEEMNKINQAAVEAILSCGR